MAIEISKKAVRVRKGLRNASPVMLLRRMARRPFRDKSRYIIVHTAHHKIGTSWFRCIFKRISSEFGLPLYFGKQSAPPRNQRVLYFQASPIIEPWSLPAYRGSHMIRDPRDVVISGYYYHRWTKESWARKTMGEFGDEARRRWPLLPIDEIQDMSYQQYLNSLSREDGLRAEIQRSSSTTIRELLDWRYDDENIFEFKYEEIMLNEAEVLRSMFSHFGFRDEILDEVVEIAQRCSFNARTGRKPGEVSEKSHHRSGKLQQWRQEFSDEHKEYFKSLHGVDLITLGYEKDLNW